jgi:hypothetical protein
MQCVDSAAMAPENRQPPTASRLRLRPKQRWHVPAAVLPGRRDRSNSTPLWFMGLAIVPPSEGFEN